MPLKRVLIISHEYPPIGGGASRQLSIIVNELIKNDKVYLLIPGILDFGIVKDGNLIKHQVKTGRKSLLKIKFRDILRFILVCNFSINKILRNFKPDLVLIFFAIPSGLLLFNRKLQSLPSVISLRGSDVPGHDNDRFKLLYRFLNPVIFKIWQRSTIILCNSDDLMSEVKYYNRINVNRIRIIPNAIECKNFYYTRRKLDSKLQLLYVGRLIPIKRIDFVIRAISNSQFLKDRLVFNIVGTGPQENILKDLVNTLGLSSVIKFHGYIDSKDVFSYYSNSDIYIQLSKKEGMSNSILEAMASGLPIVATNVGGARDLIKNNGFIVHDLQVVNIEKILCKYINEPNLIEYHSEKSREIALTYDTNQIVLKYYKLFAELVLN